MIISIIAPLGMIMGDDTLLSETIMLLRPAAGEKEGAEDMEEAVLKAVVDCASSRDSLKAASSMSEVSSFSPKAEVSKANDCRSQGVNHYIIIGLELSSSSLRGLWKPMDAAKASMGDLTPFDLTPLGSEATSVEKRNGDFSVF